MMKTVITGVLCAVLAGALGFWGGVTYQKNQTPTLASGASAARGNGNFQPPAGFDPSQMPGGGQNGGRPEWCAASRRWRRHGDGARRGLEEHHAEASVRRLEDGVPDQRHARSEDRDRSVRQTSRSATT